MIKPLFWENGRLLIVDQTRLPDEYCLIEVHDHHEMAEAIRRLAIRGAPALGIAAAYGLVLGLRAYQTADSTTFRQKLDEIATTLFATRPTAVNLGWALQRMKRTAENNSGKTAESIWQTLLAEAQAIHTEEIARCQAIARQGFKVMPDEGNLMTHCNTGGLATGGLGTALGIIVNACQHGKRLHVFVDETRPLLQGARLTAWELTQEKVPFTLICDNMAASVMLKHNVRAVIVGADRIAANGDTANKIGTYGLAVLAHYHHIPFYVAAPTSTIDPSLKSGQLISIEQRNAAEIKTCGGKTIAPATAPAISPAFDITPHKLISAIVTERGIHRPPYKFE